MASKKSKNGKVVSSLDVVNVRLQQDFEGVLNLEAEMKVYERAVGMLDSGEISVRGLKATIEAASEKGALPTIKPSTAQYFIASSKVRALEGGKGKALKDVINATIQAKRAFGKEFEAKVEEAGTFAELVRMTPSQGERAKAGRKPSKDEALITADAVVSFFVGSIRELEDLTPRDSKQWETFLGIVKTMSDAHQASKRANHPAGKKLVKA